MATVDTDDFYVLLGVPATATTAQLKRAYRRAAMKHHPDRNGDPAVMKRVNRAAEVLLDEKSRSKYDKDRTTRVARSARPRRPRPRPSARAGSAREATGPSPRPVEDAAASMQSHPMVRLFEKRTRMAWGPLTRTRPVLGVVLMGLDLFATIAVLARKVQDDDQ